ncbi:unnamed protein product [Urochloa humidicola]
MPSLPDAAAARLPGRRRGGLQQRILAAAAHPGVEAAAARRRFDLRYPRLSFSSPSAAAVVELLSDPGVGGPATLQEQRRWGLAGASGRGSQALIFYSSPEASLYPLLGVDRAWLWRRRWASRRLERRPAGAWERQTSKPAAGGGPPGANPVFLELLHI